jgi:hypothetical protein
MNRPEPTHSISRQLVAILVRLVEVAGNAERFPKAAGW